MSQFIPYEDNPTPINIEQAEKIEQLHKKLSQSEQMVVIAEYTQRNGMFAGLNAKQRREKAQRWINSVTGVWLRECEYIQSLDRFKDLVDREVA